MPLLTLEEKEALDLRGYVTQLGFNAEANAKTFGKKIKITKIQVDGGLLPSEQSPVSIERVQLDYGNESIFDAVVTEDSTNPGVMTAQVSIPVNHSINNSSYEIWGLAIIAEIEGVEFIYTYRRVEGDVKLYNADSLKSYLFRVTWKTSNASVIEYTIAPSIAYVTHQEMEEHNESEAAHADIREELSTKPHINHNHDSKYWKRGEKVNDSAQLNGHGLTDSATANTVAKRNPGGDLLARLFRSFFPDTGGINGALAFRTNDSSDNYIRFCSNVTSIKDWLKAASRPDYIYTVTDVTLIRKSDKTIVHRWGIGDAKILIDASTYRVGDIITIVNVHELSGVATITNLDGIIFTYKAGAEAATHTFTGMGQVSFVKFGSGNNFMQLTE